MICNSLLLNLTLDLLREKANTKGILSDYLSENGNSELARLVLNCQPTHRERVILGMRLIPWPLGLYTIIEFFERVIEPSVAQPMMIELLAETKAIAAESLKQQNPIDSAELCNASARFLALSAEDLSTEVFFKTGVMIEDSSVDFAPFLQPVLDSVRLSGKLAQAIEQGASIREMERRTEGTIRLFQRVPHACCFLKLYLSIIPMNQSFRYMPVMHQYPRQFFEHYEWQRKHFIETICKVGLAN